MNILDDSITFNAKKVVVHIDEAHEYVPKYRDQVNQWNDMNIIDRIYLGEVVDFFDVGLGSYRWPIFNFADSFVTVGVFVLIFIHSSGDKQDLRDSD